MWSGTVPVPAPVVRTFASVAACALMAAVAAPSWAGTLDRPGTRALGMGGALRGAATGDAGPTLNPSGMALIRGYVAEGAYQYTSVPNANFGHASIVDSTSALGLAAGLSYTYLTTTPTGGRPAPKGHQGALSLAMPFGDRLSLGVTGRYLRIETDYDGGQTSERGLAFDAGATIRVFQTISLGIVGYGLNNSKMSQAPLAVGGGLAVTTIPGLLLAADAVLTFTTADRNRGNVWSFMGGAEYTFATRLAVRGGGGKDMLLDNVYASGGLSAVSDLGAIDFGLRRDVSGPDPATYVGVSARLFVPSP